MRRAPSQSLLGPALLLYLVADASAAQGELDSVGAFTALLAGALSLTPITVLRSEVPGAQRVSWLGLLIACALVRVAAPLALSPVAELSHGLAAALSGALLVDLALAVPDRVGGPARARFGRLLAYALALAAAVLGALAYAPALALLGVRVLLPTWTAWLPWGYLALALLVALWVRALRRGLGSSPEALASNAWAVLGLVPGALAALAAALLPLLGVSPASPGMRAAVAAACAALIFGHVRLLDPSRRLGAGQATRNAVAAVLALATMAALCTLLRPLWPEQPLTIAAAVAVMLLVALALYRMLCEAVRVLLAPAAGRLLLAIEQAHDELASARELLDVARVALAAARRGAGDASAEPLLYLIDPVRELRLDAAGVAHAGQRALHAELVRELRERPGQIVLRAPLEAQLVRAPKLRPLVEALCALDALCVLPLSQYGELEGALVLPRGPRRSSLTLEELEALHGLGRHLSGFVRVLASEARTERRAAQAFAASERALLERKRAEAEAVRMSAELRALRGGTSERLRAHAVAYSEPMRALHKRLANAASGDTPVLLVCERGIPAAPLALELHEHSERAGEPFVIAECAALRREQAVAALLGSSDEAPGYLRLSGGGTLVLCDLPALTDAAQQALIAALSVGQARPAGGGEPYACRARLVASCRRDEALPPELREQFPIVLRVPPLRERPEDVASLVLLALDESARLLGRPAFGLEPAAQARLLSHDWPGNLEELHAVVELAAARCRGTRITVADLPALGPTATRENPLDAPLEAVERRVLQRALERTSGNKSEAARALGLPRTTFLDKLKRHGLEEGSGKPGPLN